VVNKCYQKLNHACGRKHGEDVPTHDTKNTLVPYFLAIPFFFTIEALLLN
jgi:hypothetical protein